MQTAFKWIGGAVAAMSVSFAVGAMAGPIIHSPAAKPDISALQPHAPTIQPAAFVTAPRPDPFVIKSVLPINGAIPYGEWHWDASAGPVDGKLVITVDLDARVISVFRDGHEIGTAAVLLGTEDTPTPTGLFPITQKHKDHVSNLYDAPMPYMMRLTNDGITIHGTTVENGYASHGCIGTPTPFAAQLFKVAKLGDAVVVTRGRMVELGDSLAS